MFEHIFTKLDPEMIVCGSILFGLLVLLAGWRPEICFALGFPAYIFLGQLKVYFPVSNSAGAALFPLAAVIGCLLRGHRLRFGSCEKLMIGLALLMAFSIYYSPNPTYGRDKTALFFFMIVPVIVFAPNIITSVKSLRPVVFILVLTFVIYVLTSSLLRSLMGSVEGRVSAIRGATQASQFLGLAVVVCWLWIVVSRRGDARKLLFFYIMAIGLLLTFMTGTRAAILALALTVPVMYWFIHIDWFQRIFNRPHKTYAMIVLAVLLVLTGRFVLKRMLPEDVYHRYTSVENFFSNFTPSEIRYWQDSSARTLNYGSAAKAFFAHPLTGVGAGGYKDVLASGGYSKVRISVVDDLQQAYPHNMVLEFATEQGILGLALILCILYLNVRMILRLRRVYHVKPQNPFSFSCCIGIYVFGLCVAMTSLDIPQMMLLWWGMGLLLAADRIFADVSSKSQQLGRYNDRTLWKYQRCPTFQS